MVEKNLTKRDNRTRFSRTRCHNQQRFTAVLFVERFANRFDSGFLIVAACNMLVYHHVFERSPHSAQVEQLFQITLGIDGRNLAFGVIFIIPNPRIETVRKEDNRSAPVFLFQKVGVKFGLLSAFGNVHAGALGF